MKKVMIAFMVLMSLFVVGLWAGRAQADSATMMDWLAEIGELNGGIASFSSNGPDCRWLAGYGVFVCPEPYPAEWPVPDPTKHRRALAQLGTGGLLLVPDSTNRRVMAFDPVSGDVVDENFIPADPDHLDLPINAMLSPAGNSVLVSAYNDDVVQEYDFMGNWLGIYAPAGGPDPTILDTPRGMDIRDNGNLLVATSRNPDIDEVVEFDSDGNSLGAFIADGLGGLDSPYDLHLWMNTWLVGGATSDALHQYSPAGAYLGDLALVNNFPQQIQAAANGNVLVANFSGTQEGVIEFDPAGSVVNNFNPLDDGQRGVYELPNGNILTTSGTTSGSVYELDRDTGTVVDTKLSGGTPRYIELVQSPYSIVLTKTVGLNPAECATADEISVPAGSLVAYCYAIMNTGAVTLTNHDLEDDPLGQILDNYNYALPPGGTVFVTQTATITQTTVNTATWIAGDGNGMALAMDTATVQALPISINLTKTVGTDPAGCALTTMITVTAGTEVTYCYTVTNTGAFTLASHDLEDSDLGDILDDFPFPLPPGATTFVTATSMVNATTTNNALWTATTTAGPSTSATAAATVNVEPVIEDRKLYLPVMLQNE